MEMSDYAQLRRRAEQCRAEEMARLFSLLKQAFIRWRTRHSSAPVSNARMAVARRRC